MKHSIWRHCSFRDTQLDPSHHQWHLVPPATQLCPQLPCQSCSSASPAPNHSPSSADHPPLPCFLTAAPAPPFGPKPLSYPWAPSPLNASSSKSSSSCFPCFYPLAPIAGAEPCRPSLLLLFVALFPLRCSIPLKHVSQGHLCHSNLPARQLLCGTLKHGANELKFRMRLISGGEEGRHSQEQQPSPNLQARHC